MNAVRLATRAIQRIWLHRRPSLTCKGGNISWWLCLLETGSHKIRWAIVRVWDFSYQLQTLERESNIFLFKLLPGVLFVAVLLII